MTDPTSHQPFYVRMAPNDARLGSAMADFACTELDVRTAATIDDGSAYSRAVQAAFARAFDTGCSGTLTVALSATADQNDFGDDLGEVAVSNDGAAPELLFYPIVSDTVSAITTQARADSGLQDTALASIETGIDGTSNLAGINAAKAAAEGMYLSGRDLESSSDYYQRVFLPEYANVSAEEKPLSTFHGYAYDAANIILDAVEKVGLIEGGILYVPRTALRDAVLATNGYQGLTGTISCDRNGDCSDPVIHVSQVVEGTPERIWP